jgi:hypothetical protein
MMVKKVLTRPGARDGREGAGDGGGVLAEGRRDAGHGAGSAMGAGLAFEPGEGGQADSGPVGKCFLGELVESAQVAEPLAVDDGRPLNPPGVAGLGDDGCRAGVVGG